MKIINYLKSSKKTKITILILGIASTIWFIIRVIPKPSRATYPCMRVAAPFMSGFVIYLVTLAGSVLAFRKAFDKFLKLKFITASIFMILALALSIVFFANDIRIAFASPNLAADDTPNSPIGVAKGIYPGRVAWVMDKNSTNENCTNKAGDYWFMDKNTSQKVVDTLLANGLKCISGQTTISLAWDSIFKYFNINHSKGNVGYVSGEKIVVKVNFTTLGNGGRNLNNAMDATPQLIFSLLKELIDTLKIAQADITIGDPYRGMPNEVYDPCHAKFQNVHYIEGLGTDGREQTIIGKDNVFFTSDDAFQSRLPQAYLDAAYLINMPCLKTHNSAGITIAAKNHQGSVIGPDQDATSQYMGSYLHYDYPVDGGAENQKMGIYRHIVDYMAHKKLGGNTLLYIVDAIWSGRNWDAVVDKWQMTPFNNDWTSSLFISQDPVAIESVGFDFLYNEYKSYPASHGNANFPLVNGVQDYIHQAADPANWPSGIEYDPSTSDHSSPVKSLGVHEHWNNYTDKKYNRNLGLNTGIELYSLVTNVSLNIANNSIEEVKELSIYPNPVKDIAILKYVLTVNSNVHFELYSMDGKTVVNTRNIKQYAGSKTFTISVANYGLIEGTYICKLVINGNYSKAQTSKIVIKK
jgi:hypothetical protein